ncbi:MAK10-like protein [Tanacetum coccineum]|uniref:MAK10-like protein n=1 Tax=Tanacetum coccineum TaxID=301880 RepID=A0ABQ5ILG0_9ASTR
MMNQQTTFQNNLQNMICGLFQNQALTSGTLPSNTIPNPKGEMKAITTRNGVAYEGPSIPTNLSPKKTLPKTTPIPESDIPKSLPKPNIPYPSRRDDQKSRDKASNQMEKIFQIFQDLRFDISFADALLLMPRFAPTIKSLLMNKEKLLELAKIPLNENCSAMLLKKLPEKLGDPGKFLIPCNFPGMDVISLADLGASINLMPLSIWKKLSLPELTPTRMTLELADRSITRPKGVAEDIFVKVRNFHFPTDFVVVDFEADPRVPLILGRSFLRTSRALIDVYEGELVLRDGNEQITFHVNGTSKHPQKHVNESIKMVNDTCKDSFKRFTDEPALVCLPPSEDVNNEKEKQEVKNLAEPTVKRQTRITPCLKNFKVICKESIFHSNKPPQVSSVFAITSTLPSIEPKDSLIMGDEHLSTFSTEEIVPIPRESEDTSRSDSKNVLPSCDDFSSIKDPRDDFVTFSNPLFEFDVNFNSSDINPLFDEELEDIECKDSYDSNLDESTFLVTPLSDSNKDESLTPRDDIEFPLHDDPSTPLKSVASILEGFIEDPPFKENEFDLECKTNDEAECFNPGGDNDEIDAFLAINVPTYIEGYYDSEGDVLYLESLISDDTTHNLSPEVFFDYEPQQLRNEPENEPLITFSPKSDPLHHEFTGELITIPLGIVREHEDYINRMSLLCSNSSSQSPENFHTIIESLPISTTCIEDSDSNREEIDIFSGPDDSIPPGIESDFDSEEDIIDNLLNNDSTHERLTFNIEPDAPVINNVDELNKDECFDPGGRFLPYFPPPKVRKPFMTPVSPLSWTVGLFIGDGTSFDGCQKPGHLAARLGCAEMKVATWDDLAFKFIILGWNVKHMKKITTSCEICSGPYDTQYCIEDPKQAFVEYASSRTDEEGGTDIAKISRKRSKPDNHRHGNGKENTRAGRMLSKNDPRDFAKPVKEITLPQDVPSTSDYRLIELENQFQRLMEAHLAPTQLTQVNKITTSCGIYSGPHDTQYCMKDPEQAFVEYASSRTDEAGEGLVSIFMASQDARLSKFKADFKQQQSEMTNKIDTILKAITDRMSRTLPRDTVKNPKLNINSTTSVLSARSYPTEDPQCSTHIHGLINTITIHPKKQINFHDNKPEENEEKEKISREDINTNSSTPPDPSVSFITQKVLKLNSFFESLGLAPQLYYTEFVCTKRDDGDVMFIEIVKKNDDSRKEEPKAGGLEVEYFDIFPTRSELAYHKYLMCGPIPSIFLRNPIIMEGCPSNLKIPCNIRHVHVEKAYTDLNSPLNIMTRMMYNWIMRRKLDPRENSDRGVSNFTRRIKGMHVFVRNFTYVMDFMIVEDISSIIDPRLSQVVLGKPFIEISNMTHDPLEGVVRFTKGTDEVAYKMPQKIEQYNSLLDLEKEHTKSVYLRNEED